MSKICLLNFSQDLLKNGQHLMLAHVRIPVYKQILKQLLYSCKTECHLCPCRDYSGHFFCDVLLLFLYSSTNRSCRRGSLVWSCRVWPARSGQCPSWWRNSSTISRCMGSTQRGYTGSQAPLIRSKNSARVWTQVRLKRGKTAKD